LKQLKRMKNRTCLITKEAVCKLDFEMLGRTAIIDDGRCGSEILESPYWNDISPLLVRKAITISPIRK